MAKSEISWVVELELDSSARPEFEALTSEMTNAAMAESGTLAYERFISPDARSVVIYERYRDDQSAIEHLERFKREFGDRLAALVERRRFLVLGTPGPELAAVFASIAQVETYPKLAGFQRQERES